jgi:hypothetical protein
MLLSSLRYHCDQIGYELGNGLPVQPGVELEAELVVIAQNNIGGGLEEGDDCLILGAWQHRP